MSVYPIPADMEEQKKVLRYSGDKETDI